MQYLVYSYLYQTQPTASALLCVLCVFTLSALFGNTAATWEAARTQVPCALIRTACAPATLPACAEYYRNLFALNTAPAHKHAQTGKHATQTVLCTEQNVWILCRYARARAKCCISHDDSTRKREVSADACSMGSCALDVVTTGAAVRSSYL